MSLLIEEREIEVSVLALWDSSNINFVKEFKKARQAALLNPIYKFFPIKMEVRGNREFLKFTRVSGASKIVTFLGVNLDLDTGYVVLDYYKNDTYYPIFNFWAYLKQRGLEADSARMRYLVEEYKLKNITMERVVEELAKPLKKKTFIEYRVSKMSEGKSIDFKEEIRDIVVDLETLMIWWEGLLSKSNKSHDFDTLFQIRPSPRCTEEEKEEVKELTYALNKMSGLSKLYLGIISEFQQVISTIVRSPYGLRKRTVEERLEEVVYDLNSSCYHRWFYSEKSDRYTSLSRSIKNSLGVAFNTREVERHRKFYSYLYNTIDLFEVIDKDVAIRFVVEEYESLHSNVSSALVKGLRLEELGSSEMAAGVKRGLDVGEVRQRIVEHDDRAKALPDQYILCKSVKAEQFGFLIDKVTDRVNNIK